MKDKCIWLIGATGGIGSALALRLAQQQNFVIASGRDKKALEDLAAAGNGRIKPLAFDLAGDSDSIENLRTRLLAVTDYVDCMIYGAGVCEYEDDLRFNPEMYSKMMEINYLGAVKSLNLAMPLLRRSSQRAQVAFIGSLSSVLGLPRAEAYGASKSALDYFVRAVKADCANMNLDVRLIRPGFIDTPLTKKNDFPMPFMLSAEDAALRIIKGLAGKRFVIDFPWRLAFTLRLCRLNPWLWYNFFAPKITRHSAKDWALDRH